MIKSLIKKVSRYTHLLFLIAIFPVASFAQVKDTTAVQPTTISPAATTTTEKPKGMHGMFYITWGYNRDAYTKSTINFKDMKTDDYDFTLHKAYARDQPDFHDLLHTPISVPQYQLNVGYMFNNKKDFGVEFAWNHLKYVVQDNQMMHLTGYIRGSYYDQDTLVTPSFVHFEHTNGNNYCVLSLVKRWKFWTSKNQLYRFSMFNKLGGGVLIPKTDSYVMGMHNDGPFKPSGVVCTFNTQFRFDFLRYLFIEAGFQGAVAYYTHAKLVKDGRAEHSFLSIQGLISGGVNIPLNKKLW